MKKIDCIPALRALGEENRLRILRLLMAEPLTVGELSTHLSLTVYNVSKHLRVLKEAALVTVTKQGQQRIYKIAEALEEHLLENKNTLDLGCCMFRFDKLPE